MNPRLVTTAARILLVAAVAVIVFLATTDRSFPFIDGIWDKAKHAAAFVALSLLLDYAFPETRFGLAKVVALLGFGVSIELIQHLLPPREASVLDLVADGAGIAIYAACIPLVARVPVLRRFAKG